MESAAPRSARRRVRISCSERPPRLRALRMRSCRSPPAAPTRSPPARLAAYGRLPTRRRPRERRGRGLRRRSRPARMALADLGGRTRSPRRPADGLARAQALTACDSCGSCGARRRWPRRAGGAPTCRDPRGAGGEAEQAVVSVHAAHARERAARQVGRDEWSRSNVRLLRATMEERVDERLTQAAPGPLRASPPEACKPHRVVGSCRGPRSRSVRGRARRVAEPAAGRREPCAPSWPSRSTRRWPTCWPG